MRKPAVRGSLGGTVRFDGQIIDLSGPPVQQTPCGSTLSIRTEGYDLIRRGSANRPS